jgi:hypothetical protein
MDKLILGQDKTRIELTTGTLHVNFRTVQAEIGKVQDNDSTKSSEIVGQYMMVFSTN